MGSYIFANQYQNEIIPEGEQVFPKHWLKYFAEIPPEGHTFCFVDPAISEEESADFTGIVVVQTDVAQNWYVKFARRERMNPSQIINLTFRLYEEYKPLVIGVEDVAFQRALVHFAYEEMKRRNSYIPIQGVRRSPDKTKHMRIMSLVPRFEWGNLFLAQGLYDLELELAQFPRGSHDDLLDALASIADIVTYPESIRRKDEPPATNSPHYEQWYIKNILARRKAESEEG